MENYKISAEEARKMFKIGYKNKKVREKTQYEKAIKRDLPRIMRYIYKKIRQEANKGENTIILFYREMPTYPIEIRGDIMGELRKNGFEVHSTDHTAGIYIRFKVYKSDME